MPLTTAAVKLAGMTAAAAVHHATAATPAELIALVQAASASRVPLVDYGVAHGGVGHPPPAEHTKLTMTAPATGGILEHYEHDLSVRATAGVAMRDLQAAMLQTGQFVPIDADDDLTLGEVVNHHVYGGLRVGYGSIRDLLLGLRFIDGYGQDNGVGGRTVKNVAGYDVTRLMVGSLGELGLIHEATLRTYAVPESVLAAAVECDGPARLDAVLADWLASEAAPAALRLSNAGGRWVIRLAYFGRPRSGAAQLDSLHALLARAAAPGLKFAGSVVRSLEQERADAAARRAWRRQARTLVKLVVPPAAAPAACRALEIWARETAPLMIDALPGHGCLWVGGALGGDVAVELAQKLKELLAVERGFFMWHARPAGMEGFPPAAPPQPDWPIMGRLKAALDPQALFNPGRLLPVGN